MAAPTNPTESEILATMGELGRRMYLFARKFSDLVSAPLRGWMGSWLAWGIEIFMDALAKSYSKKLQPMLDSIGKISGLPSEVLPLLNEIKSPTGEAGALLGAKMGSSMVGGVLDRIMNVFLAGFAADLNRTFPRAIMAPDSYIQAALRGVISEADLGDALRVHGFNEFHQKIWNALAKVLFPSDIVAPAWLRDKAKYEHFWDDVKKLGVDDEHIELLKEMAYQLPNVRDVVSFLAHEVLEPEMVSKYGLDDEWGGVDKSLFEKVGLKEDMALNYWRDHWQHATWSQVTQMLHRGLVEPPDVYDWYRLVEIPPYWRDKLTELSWDLPNRIELRMMARYGLVDKAFLVKTFEKIGLAEEYRSVVADMNLAVGLSAGLGARYRNGWISEGDVESEIRAAGLTGEVAKRLYQAIIKENKPERTAIEKDLTKAEIVKGVKLGIITWDEGVAQLEAMGYDESEAIYILAISIEAAAGSPHTLGDFKRLTELLRLAQGLPTERTREEIIGSEKAVSAKYPVKPTLSPEELKTRVDTIRRKRRRGELTRDEEVTELLKVGLAVELATAYAENDDLRLQKGAEE